MVWRGDMVEDDDTRYEKEESRYRLSVRNENFWPSQPIRAKIYCPLLDTMLALIYGEDYC